MAANKRCPTTVAHHGGLPVVVPVVPLDPCSRDGHMAGLLGHCTNASDSFNDLGTHWTIHLVAAAAAAAAAAATAGLATALLLALEA